MSRQTANRVFHSLKLAAGVVMLVSPLRALASTYGSAAYNGDTYNGSLHVGPITLPDTGSAILLAAGVAAVIAGVVLWLWAGRSRRQSQQS